MAASWVRACESMAFTESSLKTFARAIWNPMGLGVGVVRGAVGAARSLNVYTTLFSAA